MIVLTAALLLTFAAAPASKKDCRTDLNCFIKAAKTCQPAQVRNTTTVDLMGMEQKTTTHYQIDGASGLKCKLVQTIEKMESRMGGKALKAFKAENPQLSDREIRKGEEDQNKAMQAHTGKPVECLFSNKALVDVLTHTRDGQFDSREWAAGCPQAR
jgi:cytochrome c oxidase assembly protein Cox11